MNSGQDGPSAEAAQAALHSVERRSRPLARSDGYANWVFLGPDAVLRVCRKGDAHTAAAWREGLCSEFLPALGIKTPRLVAFSEGDANIPGLHSISELAAGTVVSKAQLDSLAADRFWSELGVEIAGLHDRIQAAPTPRLGWRPPKAEYPARWMAERRVLDKLASDGLLQPVTDLVARLSLPLSSPVEPVFLHGDLSAANLFTSVDGAFAAFIDWGDAGWGDPAMDLARVPLARFEAVLAAYDGASRRPLGAAGWGRMRFYALGRALRFLSGDIPILGEIRALLAQSARD